jgi:hypothetical protein
MTVYGDVYVDSATKRGKSTWMKTDQDLPLVSIRSLSPQIALKKGDAKRINNHAHFVLYYFFFAFTNRIRNGDVKVAVVPSVWRARHFASHFFSFTDGNR